MLAKDYLLENSIINIGPCDSSYNFNKKLYQKIISDTDIIVWSFKNKLTAKNPSMFGWIKLKNKKIEEIVCKKQISSNPENDYAIVGAFTFKSKRVFMECFNSLFNKKRKINGEYYIDLVVDEGIKLGFNVSMLNTEDLKSYGTPNDYEANK